MKKFLVSILVLVMIVSMAACGGSGNDNPDPPTPVDYTAKSEGVMTYAEYAAADLDSEVIVEVFVQAHQSWWDNKISVYAADPDGGYFLYNLACSEADSAKLTPGTKIKVSGIKGAYAGEIELMDATFVFCESGSGYIAEATDATAWLGTDELEKHINEYISFKGLTLKAVDAKESDSDPDLYVTVESNGAEFKFCVENYLTGPDTDVYKAIKALEPGTVIDLTGFNYWYNGCNMHITGVTKQ